MSKEQIDKGLELTPEEKERNPIISATFSRLSDRQKQILGIAAGTIALSAFAFATVSTFGLAVPVAMGIVALSGAIGGIAGARSPKTALKSLSISTMIGAGVGLALGGPVGAAIGASIGSGVDIAVRMHTKERWSTNRVFYSSIDYIGSKLGLTKPKISTQAQQDVAPTPTPEHSLTTQKTAPELKEEAQKVRPNRKRSRSSPPAPNRSSGRSRSKAISP